MVECFFLGGWCVRFVYGFRTVCFEGRFVSGILDWFFLKCELNVCMYVCKQDLITSFLTVDVGYILSYLARSYLCCHCFSKHKRMLVILAHSGSLG